MYIKELMISSGLTWLVVNMYFIPLATCPTTIMMLVMAGLEWTTSVKWYEARVFYNHRINTTLHRH